MIKLAGIKTDKFNFKLVLCVMGIIAVIAILVSMRPLPIAKRSVIAARPNSGPPAAIASDSSISQASPTAAEAGGLSRSSGIGQPSSTQPTVVYVQPKSMAPDMTAANTAQSSVDPTVLYPIDPVPCKTIGYKIGCGKCETYTGPDGQIATCLPKCPSGGVEMMCAYPL